MQTAYVNGIRRRVPESWDDILQNRKLLLWVLSLYFLKLNAPQLLAAAAYKFLKIGGIRQKRVQNLLKNHPESPDAEKAAESLFRASEAFSFLVKEPFESKENLFPSLFRFRKLHAPDKVLTSFGIWEYALAENAFFKFAADNNGKHLDELISITYRRKKFFWFLRKNFKSSDGDRRAVFNENTYKNQIPRVSKLPLALKWLVYRWFAQQRARIIDAHPHTFKSAEGGSGGGTWADTILAMSEVGSEDIVANTKLSIILRRIDNENKAAEKLKSQNRKHDVEP